MAGNNFFQELKRRNVYKVAISYIVVAWLIMQVGSIVLPTLNAPEWVMKVLLFFLVIGFPIALILAWAFEMSPEGIITTTSVEAEENPYPDRKKKPLTSMVAIGVLLLAVVGLLLYNTYGSSTSSDLGMSEDAETRGIDKSIAVLPFKNSSTNEENQHFCDGMMEGILNNLAKIGDLTVVSRTSVEQYRDDPPSTFDIAKQLDVNYILEGSVLRFGDQAQINAQLIYVPDDKPIWSDRYERELRVEDLFGILNEITDTIAGKLQATISPEVKRRIEAVPTTSLTAYDFYQRGREEHVKYWLDRDNRKALERAEDLYHEALEYDSAFAQAFTGLAWVYSDKYYWETFFTENFLDSMLILADIALSFNDQLAEAYVIRGDYYRLNNKKEQAINQYEKAIRFNPNDGQAYWGRGLVFQNDDLVRVIDNFQKATSLDRGPTLPRGYRSIGQVYAMAGFEQKAYYYAKEALKLDYDSAAYYRTLFLIEDQSGNYEKAIEFGEKAYAIDSTDLFRTYLLGCHYMFLGQKEESLRYLKKYEQRLRTFDRPDPNRTYRIGQAYLINGFEEEAARYFVTGLEQLNKMTELSRYDAHREIYTFYSIAAIYAILGDKDKAYKNLRRVNQRDRIPLWQISLVKVDPSFDNIRGEPEFLQIVKNMEVKYQIEHERVRVWLEKEGML